MKVLGTLLLVSVALFHCIDAKHHSKHHHENKSLARRSLNGIFDSACNFACGSTGENSGPAVASWSIDLTEHADIGLVIAYEGNTKSLAFINVIKKVVVVFTGTKGIFGIFNIATSAGIIVNIATGVARYVTISDNSSLFFGASANIYAGVYALANVIYANSSYVTKIYASLLLEPLLFNFNDFISNLISGSFNLQAFFLGKYELYSKIKASFEGVFVAVKNSSLVKEGYTFAFGSLNVLVGIMGEVTGVAYGFLAIAYRFSTSVVGFVNGSLQYQLFSQVALYVSAFRLGVITGVNLMSDLTLSFTKAGAAVFDVTVNGLITVAGAIKGGIDSLVSVVGGIIGSANIGVGVHFEAGVALSASVAGAASGSGSVSGR